MAVKAAEALLTAMDTEEPFRLLRTLPGKLEELWAIERQDASAEKWLAEDISLSQSKVCDSIHSASSRILECNKEVRSLLDAHVQHLQREADDLQESLEKLHDHQSNTLPRRHRAKVNSFNDLDDELSRLQDTTAQIRDIAHYVCDVAMGLARDEASFNALARETLHELGLTLDGDGAWSMPPDHPTDEEAHGSTQILVENMEKRCEDLETYITFNKYVVDKQTQQIETLRRMLNTFRDPACGGSGGKGTECHRDLVPYFTFSVTVVFVALIILMVLR